MPFTLAMLDPMTPVAFERLQSMLPDNFKLITTASRSAEDQMAAITAANFAITGDMPVTASMFQAGAANGLLAVHKWGVGYDNIDIAAARSVGVRVFRTTGSNAVPVAETAVALMLAVQRNIVSGHIGLLNDQWLKGKLPKPTVTLSNKTVGLIGLGYIGKEVAKILRGFSCRILYYKPNRLDQDTEKLLGVEYAPLDDLISSSNVISIHCSLSPDTMNLIDAAAIGRMKPGSVLVNTSRGGIIDEIAAEAAVRSGHLLGVGLDVFGEEPIGADHLLVGKPGIVVTPHIAAGNADGYVPTVNRMIGNFLCIVDGKEPTPIDTLC